MHARSLIETTDEVHAILKRRARKVKKLGESVQDYKYHQYQ